MTIQPAYTVLRITPAKEVPLRRRHAERLGHAAEASFTSFLKSAAPGIHRVWWDGTSLGSAAVAASRLFEGIPVRLLPSPFSRSVGAFPKPRAPSPYDGVRLANVATLLTNPGGTAIQEACSAGVIAWNGHSVVLVPEATPRVASLAEAALAAHEPVTRALIATDASWPLLLCNAVVGTCAITSARPPFPADVRARLDAILSSSES